LGIGLIILIVGIKALSSPQQVSPTYYQEPTTNYVYSPNTEPSTPHIPFGTPSFQQGYRDGYYGRGFAPPDCSRQAYEWYFRGWRDPPSYEKYCAPILLDRDNYIDGYIQGSIGQTIKDLELESN